MVMPPGNAAGLPPYTVLDGHRRGRLLQSIGAKEATVIVRHDLKDADLATVNLEFLKINFQRRNMDRLEMARVAKGMYETEVGCGSRQFDPREKKQFQERLSAVMGMSGKTLQRYISLLTTPLPIQNAFRQGQIKLVVGVTISTLPRPKQQELAERIEKLTGKKEIQKIVSEYVTTRESGRHARPSLSFGYLKQFVADAEGRIDEIPAASMACNLDLLRQARKMIDESIKRGENAPPPEKPPTGLSAFVAKQDTGARRRSTHAGDREWKKENEAAKKKLRSKR
jgi:hypothetical protein